jgi:hypothetical protein
MQAVFLSDSVALPGGRRHLKTGADRSSIAVATSVRMTVLCMESLAFQWQVVPGAVKISRVICFCWCTGAAMLASCTV